MSFPSPPDLETEDVKQNTNNKTPVLATAEQVFASGRVDPAAVEVFQRTDGMGRSVRTRRPFKRGQVVCSYGGRVHRTTELTKSDYFFQLSNKYVVDGDPNLPESQGHVGNLVNDACGPIRVDGVTNNLYFSIGSIMQTNGEKIKTVLLKTKRALPEVGTELFISYGPSYWHEMKRSKFSDE